LALLEKQYHQRDFINSLVSCSRYNRGSIVVVFGVGEPPLPYDAAINNFEQQKRASSGL
jgi:hypothetical protein